jgi:sugar/nucleoside kinase (ribokinase family)
VPALPPLELVDVVGAGDAFKAGFLAGLRQNLSLQSCGLLGAATASCVLEGVGLEVVPTLEMVRQTLNRNAALLPEWH